MKDNKKATLQKESEQVSTKEKSVKKLPSDEKSPNLQQLLKRKLTQKNLINIEEEVFKIKQLISKNLFSQAEEKVLGLLEEYQSPRLFSLAGKIDFFQCEYRKVVENWSKVIEAGGEITLRVYHRHGLNRKGCSGYLLLKKGLIEFRSARYSNHSFILSESRIEDIRKTQKGILFTGRFENGTRKNVLSTVATKDVERKERFLAYFLKKFIFGIK